MAAAWLRHPRYSLLILVTLISTFYLLFVPHQLEQTQFFHLQDSTLDARIQRSHKIYDKLLAQRQGLLNKFGPNPKDIALFPPDKAPWPPYTVWDFFPPAFNCPYEVERLGALGDGGKWVCGLSRVAQKPDCIIYSFGSNYESSFESGILSNTKYCQIWGYDHVTTSFGPEIPKSLLHRTHFKPFRLSAFDKHGPHDGQPMYTLESLMKMNGHTHIDILKVDIEGWEFDTIAALLTPYISSNQSLPFGQLQLEIHIWDKSFAEYLTWWETLEKAGLRPFWTEPNIIYQNYNKKHTADLAEYSFLNVKGDNVFISDRVFLLKQATLPSGRWTSTSN